MITVDDLRELFIEFISPAVSSILNFLSDSFFEVFEWLSNFLIIDFFPEVGAFGLSCFDSVGSLISSNISNGNFIYVMIGALFGFPLFKICINIIRG